MLELEVTKTENKILLLYNYRIFSRIANFGHVLSTEYVWTGNIHQRNNLDTSTDTMKR